MPSIPARRARLAAYQLRDLPPDPAAAVWHVRCVAESGHESEAQRHIAETEHAAIRQCAFRGDALAVDVGAVRGLEVDDVPRAALEQERRVRGRDASVVEADLVVVAAAERAHGTLEAEDLSSERAARHLECSERR